MNEGSPSVSPSPITRAALYEQRLVLSLCGGRLSSVLCFGLNAYCPDEAQKFSADSSDTVGFVLTGSSQLL
jgi:hypothetical protein